MIGRPPRSTPLYSSAASDVYKRQHHRRDVRSGQHSITPAETREDARVFGGPVQTERGFVLHDTLGNWESTLRINDKLALTTSRDILEAIGVGQGPRNVIVTLGYAGWDQGQLEHEITENIWLTVPASEHILFDLPPEERLPAAMALLGVNYVSLVEDAGHA